MNKNQRYFAAKAIEIKFADRPVVVNRANTLARGITTCNLSFHIDKTVSLEVEGMRSKFLDMLDTGSMEVKAGG